MDLRDFTLEMMLEYLKNKGILSGLEQDILSSIQTLIKNSVDRQSVINKIKENDFKHTDIQLHIKMQPDTVSVPFAQLTEEGLKNSLLMQIQHMWLKEAEQISHQ